MRDHRQLRSLVRQILLDDRQCRNSDDLLYLRVIHKLTPEFVHQPFDRAIMNPLIPKRRSVERARRWVQAHVEGTQADSKIEAWREINEKLYREEYGNGRG